MPALPQEDFRPLPIHRRAYRSRQRTALSEIGFWSGMGHLSRLFVCPDRAGFIDLDHRILPDSITLNGIWIGALINVYLAPPSPLVSRILRAMDLEITNPRLIALMASLLGIIVFFFFM